MPINHKSVEFHWCHAKRHSICFYHNIKDNERCLCQDLLTTENTDSDLNVHALHYATNELIVRVRLSFQKLLQTRSTCENNTKKCWEKSNDAYSLSIRVQITINHISICFYHNINVKENSFFFWARVEIGIVRHIDASRVAWTLIDNNLVIFDWFVLSMRMQVIQDSLFARPGSAPIRGGKKREYRDWTYITLYWYKAASANEWSSSQSFSWHFEPDWMVRLQKGRYLIRNHS